MSKKHLNAVAVTLAFAASLTGCSVNPVTGEKQLSLIPESQELAMGAEQYIPTQPKQRAADRPCLSNTLDLYREDWMRVMLRRENRISDASVVGNLERNGAFFASSCLLILAGIITALGYTSEAMEVFATLPFSVVPNRAIWELRLVVLLVVFVYAFFKFTWSMRMYNFVSVMVGSTFAG